MHPRTLNTDGPTEFPTVSVIVPIYKVEPMLRRCIDSLLAQTYPNIEIVLVDDGSPDGCPAIVDEYAEKHGSVIVPIHQENKGLGPARNAGIAASSGELLSFVDSDDYVSPAFLSTMVTAMQRANADVVVCSFMFDFPSGGSLPFTLMTPRRKMSGDQAVRRSLNLLAIPVFAWNKLYRRELFEETKIAFPTIYYEDVATITRVLSNTNRVAVTHRPLYHYCLRADSITRVFGERNVHDYVSAANIIRNFLWDSGQWKDMRLSYWRFLLRARIQLTYTALQRGGVTLRERMKLVGRITRDFKKLRPHPDRAPALETPLIGQRTGTVIADDGI